jgi:hypothetical protein
MAIQSFKLLDYLKAQELLFREAARPLSANREKDSFSDAAERSWTAPVSQGSEPSRFFEEGKEYPIDWGIPRCDNDARFELGVRSRWL